MSELFDRYYEALRKPKVAGGAARISGAGRLAGGRYESVVISGAGSVEGDLEAGEVKCAGATSFRGSVTAVRVSLAGATKVEGNLRAELVKVSGSLRVEGRLEGGEVRVAGALKASSVKGKLVELAGAFSVREGVEGEVVELRLSDDSRAAYVKGVEVAVERARGVVGRGGLFSLLLRGRRTPVFKVNAIEADHVLVDDVAVEGAVKAKRVELRGRGEVRGPVEGEVVRR
jgi:cytoskeletal protein CcmA (bactofilin family)